MSTAAAPATASRPVIEAVTVADIAELARREAEAAAAAAPGAIVPISQSRARAWAANPHAAPGDVALIVARVDGRVAGYLGLMPSLIAAGSHREPMSWFSTFYVPEELRGQAVGGLLVMKALSLGRTLAASGPSDEASATFEAVGFTSREVRFHQLDSMRARNYLGLPLRTGRRALQKLGKPVPGPLDSAIAGLSRLNAAALLAALHAEAARRLGRWTTEPLPDLPAASEPPPSGAHVVRDEAVLNWMIHHPWTTTDRALSSPAYYFDDHRDRTEYQVLDVRGPVGGSAGWVIVWFDSRNDHHRLQVLDHDLDPEVASEALLLAGLDAARRFGANDVLLPARCGPALRRLGPLGPLFREVTRRDWYRPHPRSGAGELLADLRPSFVDGDGPYA